MKNKLLSLAAALVLLMVLEHFYAKPLLAQIRAALIVSVDEPARTPWQVTFSGRCANDCYLYPQPVPAHKRLHITHISVSANFGSNFGMDMGKTDASGKITVFPSLAGYVATSADSYLNQPVDLYVDSGESLYFHFGLFPNISFSHTATGYLVDCTTAACAPIVQQ
jgi:hypothetical protein